MRDIKVEHIYVCGTHPTKILKFDYSASQAVFASQSRHTSKMQGFRCCLATIIGALEYPENFQKWHQSGALFYLHIHNMPLDILVIPVNSYHIYRLYELVSTNKILCDLYIKFPHLTVHFHTLCQLWLLNHTKNMRILLTAVLFFFLCTQ